MLSVRSIVFKLQARPDPVRIPDTQVTDDDILSGH